MGWGVLHYAAKLGHSAVVTLLLQRDVDIFAANDDVSPDHYSYIVRKYHTDYSYTVYISMYTFQEKVPEIK